MVNFSKGYTFNVKNIQNLVQCNRIGNYRLGCYSPFTECYYVKCVGRSNDLRRRLMEHIADGDQYTVFWFGYANSENEAYKQECNDYHYFSRPTGSLDNRNHPATPVGVNLSCTICGR